MNSILGIQILGVLFVLFMAYLTFLHQKRKNICKKETIMWIFVWIVALILFIIPNILDFFVKGVLQLERRIDFFIIIGIMFFMGLSYYDHIMTNKTQKKVEYLVRKIAIERKNFVSKINKKK
ncbi:DUF2304 domain-containing protein [Candidatus Woesearchaeota archaeon]|jgi:hypothetical protein|nr:DUF2304 domain-containing protein [Candidatus Woesearchaeota archaeon]